MSMKFVRFYGCPVKFKVTNLRTGAIHFSGSEYVSAKAVGKISIQM